MLSGDLVCDMAVELCVICGALSCSYGEKADKQDHYNLVRKSPRDLAVQQTFVSPLVFQGPKVSNVFFVL